MNICLHVCEPCQHASKSAPKRVWFSAQCVQQEKLVNECNKQPQKIKSVKTCSVRILGAASSTEKFTTTRITAQRESMCLSKWRVVGNIFCARLLDAPAPTSSEENVDTTTFTNACALLPKHAFDDRGTKIVEISARTSAEQLTPPR